MATGKIDIADVNAKLGPTPRTRRRVSDLSLRQVRDFQCPRCRIQNKMRSVLVPVPSSSEEILRCYFCGEDYTKPHD